MGVPQELEQGAGSRRIVRAMAFRYTGDSSKSPRAAVCKGGHVQTWFLYAFESAPRCPRCGKPVLTECPHCNAALPADSEVAQRVLDTGEDVPYHNNCAECGKPYPWEAKRSIEEKGDMSDLLDSLESDLDKLQPRDESAANALRRRALMVVKKLFTDDNDYQVDILNIRFNQPTNLWPTLDDEEDIQAQQDTWNDAVAQFRNIIRIMREDLNLGSPVGAKRTTSKNDRDVFIIHGHDENLRNAVENLIRKIGLNPIILDDQVNRGLTVIEKFEAHADVRFAVAIMSADDLGRAKNEAALRPRVRQNVIFELGYFFGTLGRKNVAALLPETVEEPTDIKGVLWIPMHNDWKNRLVKELRAAGLAANANAI